MRLGTILFSHATYFPYRAPDVPGALLLSRREYKRREREVIWAALRKFGHDLVDAVTQTRKTFGRPRGAMFIFPQPKRKQ